jgi:hypothetical protein
MPFGQILDSVFDVITGGREKQASDAQRAATAQFANLQLPSIEEMKVKLEQLVLQGQITPEQAQAALVERSRLEDISLDPRLREAQLASLAKLNEISEGGLTLRDKANLERIKAEQAAFERGQREAILQNAQARGVAGSGLELAQSMLTQQQGANRAAQQGLDVAALAQERALQAILQGGQLGGQIRGQDFEQQARVAQARDAIAQFNAQNQQQVNLANMQARQQAQMQNLAERQRIADANVMLRNQQEATNKALIQQDFENRYRKAGGVASGYQNEAAMLTNQGLGRMNFIGGLAQSAATAGAASDRNVKKQVEEFDSSKFLDEITGYRYRYKNPQKHGEGEQVGIMAQDLQKVAPQAVVKDKDGTLMIDYSKLGGPILAALADMNNRLSKIEDKSE